MATYQDVFKRVELKYLLSARQYEALRERLTDLAEPDAYGESQILNIYYDTPDFRLIRSSLMKPVYKEKLRLRSYGVPTGETNTFVELKKKYKGVVYKRRVNMSYREAGYFLGNGILQHEPSQIEKGKTRNKKALRKLRVFFHTYIHF